MPSRLTVAGRDAQTASRQATSCQAFLPLIVQAGVSATAVHEFLGGTVFDDISQLI